MIKKSKLSLQISENQDPQKDIQTFTLSTRVSQRKPSKEMTAFQLHRKFIPRRLTQLPLTHTPELIHPQDLPNFSQSSKLYFLVKPSNREISELADLIISLPSKVNFLSKVLNLPVLDESKKTLILDLDETLTHTVRNDEEGHVQIWMNKNMSIKVNIRPFAVDLLKYAASEYEVVVFTASKRKYANAILNHLDPANKYISYRLYRENCYVFNENYVKDIRVLGGRDIRNIVIVDNLLTSFALQVENGIPVSTWTGDLRDSQLKQVIDYLRVLKITRDVRTVNRNTFGIGNLVNEEILRRKHDSVSCGKI